MKRFFLKSIACLSIAFFLASVLPSGLINLKIATYNTALAQEASTTGPKYNFTYDPNKPIDTTIKWGPGSTSADNNSYVPTTVNPLINPGTEQTRVNNSVPISITATTDKNGNVIKTEATYGNPNKSTVSSPEVEGNMFTRGMVAAFNWILFGISKALAFLIGAAGYILDKAIDYSMTLASNPKLISQVQVAWVIFRDAFNLTFIFILLYVAITTILQITKTNTKKMLANVVIAALLINFSLMITKVVIDASNIFTQAVYSKITTTAIPKKFEGRISNSLMQALSLQSIDAAFLGNNDVNKKSLPTSSVNLILVQIITITMYAVVLWAFMQIAILMITRVVVFFLLMALSPIGFVGNIIPKMAEYTKQWWDTLLDQALVGPIFMFLMLVVIKLTESLSPDLIKALNDKNVEILSLFGLMLNTVIVVGLLIATVKTTKKLSGEAGAMATGFGAKVLGAGIGLATGGGAFLGRNIIGGTMAHLANKESFKEAAAKKTVGGFAARMALIGTDKIAKSSFDARNTGLSKSASKSLGLDVGKGGGTGGFRKQAENWEKRTVETAKLMETDLDNTKDKRVQEKINAGVIGKLEKDITSGEESTKAKSGEKTELQTQIDELNKRLNPDLSADSRDKIIKERDEVSRKMREKVAEIQKIEAKRKADAERLAAIKSGALADKKELGGGDEEKTLKGSNQAVYADTINSSVLAVIAGGKKGQRSNAKKIRDLFKGKTTEQKAVDLFKEMQEGKEKEKDASKAAEPKKEESGDKPK